VIVDTSVLAAIAFGEDESKAFLERIATGAPAISAATLVESEIVVRGRRGEAALHGLRALVAKTAMTIVPFDEHHAQIASEAYARYGRGSGHPAKLNYGDCFSYALAIARDEPLLFKGDDFVHTDVRSAAAEA